MKEDVTEPPPGHTRQGILGPWWEPIAAAAAALASVSVCGYRYGIADQAQYLVSVIAVRQGDVFGDDPYLSAFESLRSIFWRVIALLGPEAIRPAVCLAVLMLLAFVNALLLLAIGRTLLAARSARLPRWAAIATVLVFIVPKEQNWFGLVALADVELTATVAALPLVFGAILAWIRGRRFVCLLLGVAAVPIHGQTAAALLSAWWAASMWDARTDPRRLLWPLAVGLAGAAGLAFERASIDVAPENLATYEQIGLGLYPDLLTPLAVPASAWAALGAVLLLGVAASRDTQLARPARATPRPAERLVVWAVASCLFPAAGIGLLALGLQEPVLWRLMVGRALMLPQIVALIAFSIWAVHAMSRGGRHAVGAGLGLLFVTCWPVDAIGAVWSAAALAALIVFVATHPAGHGAASSAPARPLAAGVAVSIVVVTGLAVVRFVDRPYPWLASGADAAWLETQAWARTATEPGTCFLTPPYLSGWRVESHRASYGELKDGWLIFYQGEPVLAWATRMRLLGAYTPSAGPRPATDGGGARRGPVDEWREIRQRAYRRSLTWHLPELLEHDPDIAYLVTEADHDVSVGTVVWRNTRFVVRRVERAP